VRVLYPDEDFTFTQRFQPVNGPHRLVEPGTDLTVPRTVGRRTALDFRARSGEAADRKESRIRCQKVEIDVVAGFGMFERPVDALPAAAAVGEAGIQKIEQNDGGLRGPRGSVG